MVVVAVVMLNVAMEALRFVLWCQSAYLRLAHHNVHQTRTARPHLRRLMHGELACLPACSGEVPSEKQQLPRRHQDLL